MVCIATAHASVDECFLTMPLFAMISGPHDEAARQASNELQTWLNFLSIEEYNLLTEELKYEDPQHDRPMVSRANAVMDRLKLIYGAEASQDSSWSLFVEDRL